jgi:hypothetical protein
VSPAAAAAGPDQYEAWPPSWQRTPAASPGCSTTTDPATTGVAGAAPLAEPARTPCGVQAQIRQVVRGVVISRRTVGVDEWLLALAEDLTRAAHQNARARAALDRLLGGSAQQEPRDAGQAGHDAVDAERAQ